VGEGGLLHDLGKSRIPADLLNKHGALDSREWNQIKRHPAEGVEIAEENGEHNEITLTIIGQHHERLSGSGYPRRLTAAQLGQFARMASIADVYDAITTNRPYAKMQTPIEAVRIIQSQPQDLDQEILSHFIRLLAVK
jgi:HD-GYP domain-containing protein (c-di-GMP phosphodiesterase class II)